MPDQAPEAEARAFAVSFRSFLDWIHQGDRESGERNPVAALTADFLGPEAAAEFQNDGLEIGLVHFVQPVLAHQRYRRRLARSFRFN